MKSILPKYLQSRRLIPLEKLYEKLVHVSFFSHNEILISKYIIETIPYYYHFFLPIRSYKNVRIPDSSTPLILLTFPLQESCSTILYPKKKIFISITGFYRCIEIFRIMKKYGIVHNNICKKTMIFKNERPYLWDFSHSFLPVKMNSSTLSNIFGIYHPNSKNHPPSYHILCYMIQNKNNILLSDHIEVVLQEYTINLKVEITDFYQIWKKRLEHWTNKSIGEIVELSLKECFFWDMYSVSYLYLQRINEDDNDNIIFIQKFIDFLKKTMTIYFDSPLEDRYEFIF
jgi:hypothetical protein